MCFFGTGIGLFQALSLASELEEKLKLSVKLYFSAQNRDQWNTRPTRCHGNVLQIHPEFLKMELNIIFKNKLLPFQI